MARESSGFDGGISTACRDARCFAERFLSLAESRALVMPLSRVVDSPLGPLLGLVSRGLGVVIGLDESQE